MSSSPSSSSVSAALVGASAAASYNMIFQLALRILTFGLNAFTLRFVTKDLLGIVNVRLMLIYTTIMVLSQEPFRRASLSKSSGDSRLHWRKVINLFWISFPFVVLLAVGVGAGWAFLLSAPDDYLTLMPSSNSSSSSVSSPSISTSFVSPYSMAIFCFCLSALIDAASSPLLVLSQAFFISRLKVGAESLGILAKTLTTVILLLHPDSRHLGLHIFSLAQLAFAAVKSATYFAYFASLFASSNNNEQDPAKERKRETTNGKLPPDFPFETLRDFLPSMSIESSASSSTNTTTSNTTPTTITTHSTSLLPPIDPTLASLSWTFAKQTLVKQLLTEGERYVMTFFDALSFADQGVYDVVNNLGSLVVRFLFQPIEESGNVFFSRTLKRGGGAAGAVAETFGGKDDHDDESRVDTGLLVTLSGGVAPKPVDSADQTDEGGIHANNDGKDWLLASTVLRHLLRFVMHLGLLALVFGQSYSHLALHLFGGSTLSTGVGPDLLRAYCVYVLVIAVNGTLEAFVTAVMKKSEVDSYSRFMVGFSAAFVAATLALTRLLGSYGFIFANCLNMLMRIGYCLKFVVDYCRIRDSSKSPSIHPLFGLRVPSSCLIAYSAALILTRFSEKWFYGNAVAFRGVVFHIGVGGFAVVLTVGVVLWAEREMIDFVRRSWADMKKK